MCQKKASESFSKVSLVINEKSALLQFSNVDILPLVNLVLQNTEEVSVCGNKCNTHCRLVDWYRFQVI